MASFKFNIFHAAVEIFWDIHQESFSLAHALLFQQHYFPCQICGVYLLLNLFTFAPLLSVLFILPWAARTRGLSRGKQTTDNSSRGKSKAAELEKNQDEYK